MVAIIGILDASYITWEKVNHVIPPCSPGFACETVLTSKWASIGPVPLSALGLLFYVSVLLIASLLFLEIPYIKIAKSKFSVFQILQFLTAFGFLFSLYLVFVMGVLIQGWCLYCLFSAATSTTLFILTRALKGDPKETDLHREIISFLYSQVLKPIFFHFDPEFIHHQMVVTGVFLGSFGLGKWFTKQMFSYQNPKLEKDLAGIHFTNPVGLSAGFDWDADLPEILPYVGFGFATIGTVTLESYAGNERPRLSRFPDSKALLVNKGFQSMGARALIKKLNEKTFAIPIGISIGATNRQYRDMEEQMNEIVKAFKLFENSKVDHSYYELNISCPNLTTGQPFTKPSTLSKLLSKLDVLDIARPVFVKMPIDLPVSDTMALIEQMKKHKWIIGVILGNLTKDHANPAVTTADREKWRTMRGNLSGKPTFERSNNLIRATRKKFGKRFIIVGTGGIFTPEDAKIKMKCGADLVQLITGMIYEGPQLIGQINKELV